MGFEMFKHILGSLVSYGFFFNKKIGIHEAYTMRLKYMSLKKNESRVLFTTN